MKALRVPAGVYVNGVALGGRFVDPGALAGIAAGAEGDGAERVLDLIYSQLDKATRTQERFEQKFDNDPKRYAKLRGEAERVRELWESVAEQTDTVFQGEEEEFAVEWEIGFDYDATKGVPSDVDVNIRIMRKDAALIGQTEAAALLREFRERLMLGIPPIPLPYKMAFINWRRPHAGTGWRPGANSSGTQADFEAFESPMFVSWEDEWVWDISPSSPVRMGSVKRFT